MRSMSVVLGAFVALVVSGCGFGQPRIYKVAIDTTALASAPASCYRGNNPPAVAVTTNQLAESQWVFWDGESGQNGATYLDVGTVAFPLGSAAPIAIGGIIRGEPNAKEFTTSRSIACQNALVSAGSTSGSLTCSTQADGTVTQVTQNAVVKFDTLGATATGTITLTSNYVCNGSACGNTPLYTNCSLTLNFVGRKIEVQQTSNYAPVGQL